jgi:RNA polymerase sigma factor (sigma-70 family)
MWPSHPDRKVSPVNRRRERAAGPGRPADVTPDDAPANTTQVDAAELVKLEAHDEGIRRAALSLAGRHHDLRLLEELTAEAFEGVAWDRFASELARYAVAVMLAWLRTGEIVKQCQRLGFRVGISPSNLADEDRVDLAHDTVVQGLVDFKAHALLGGGWTFDGGASLKTYFMGRCKFAFRNVSRNWLTQQRERLQTSSVGAWADEIDWLTTPGGDPAEAAARRQEVQDALAELPDERSAFAVTTQSMGYTYAEIAELLETSVGTVRQLLARHRARNASGKEIDR